MVRFFNPSSNYVMKRKAEAANATRIIFSRHRGTSKRSLPNVLLLEDPLCIYCSLNIYVGIVVRTFHTADDGTHGNGIGLPTKL
jgi:hypothetical protein